MKTIFGNIVDIHHREIFYGSIEYNEKISNITKINIERPDKSYILPGLVDSHIHIESSMLIPCQFTRMVLPHGTVAVVADPHEIANVLGFSGVEYMIENAKHSPLKIYFTAPSCVPATDFETNGFVLSSSNIAKLLSKDSVVALAEMMNYPGVINEDAEVISKISAAKALNKPIDGHAPGLSGDLLMKYLSKGISTDHECSTLEEAREKLNNGVKIQIREGSAARNYESLKSLIASNPDSVMFCTDDAHPDDISVNGHIDKIVRKAINDGYDIFDILSACHKNPIEHYGLKVGSLRENDSADFIVVDSLKNFKVQSTVISGEEVFVNKRCNFDIKPSEVVNNFVEKQISIEDIELIGSEIDFIKVIKVIDGELLTDVLKYKYETDSEQRIKTSVDDDVLKIVVVNRYNDAKPAVAYVKGFGLKRGALASSVAHDSHNIICVGVDDESIVESVNHLLKIKGGLYATDGSRHLSLSLPIAGLMADRPYEVVSNEYSSIVEFATKNCQSVLKSPFMTMAFLSLLVIPHLKLGDRGLFDVDSFGFTNIFDIK